MQSDTVDRLGANQMACERNGRVKCYLHFVKLPFKIVGCWEWFPKTKNEKLIIFNYLYVGVVLLTLSNITTTLIVHLCTEWQDVMSSLDIIADSLPLLVSLAIVSYYAAYRNDLYDLVEFIDDNFKHRSARGLSTMTMKECYSSARNFGRFYTACTMFSVTIYVLMPIVIHLWTGEPIPIWMYMDADKSPYLELVCLRLSLAQMFVGLAMGQFGVFFAANSILLCGQLDLLCCSLRNVRYTALLSRGVAHSALAATHTDITEDERHHYAYNQAEIKDCFYNYDEKVRTKCFMGDNYRFDMYGEEYEESTMEALGACAKMYQVINKYKEMFENFVSPLLALRVVQVTLYLCILLYTATLNVELVTVEYLVATALDIFLYCYYGNQIIIQADRVSTAAYQSFWYTMGVRPRRVLLNIIIENKRPVVIRAGKFLPIDLHTFVVILKTSFSYYTLLVNVNEK